MKINKKIMAAILSVALATSSFSAIYATVAPTQISAPSASKITYTKATASQSAIINAFFKTKGWDLKGVQFSKPSNITAVLPKATQAKLTSYSKRLKLTGEIKKEIYQGKKIITIKDTAQTYTVYFTVSLNSTKTKVVGALIEAEIPNIKTKIASPANIKPAQLETLVKRQMAKNPTSTPAPSPAPVQAFDIKGTVSTVESKTGLGTILVEGGQKFGSTYDSVLVNIDQSTAITFENQLTMDLKSIADIKVGDTVQVKLSGPVSRSMPAKATAGSIIIIKKTDSLVRGTVQKIDAVSKSLDLKNTLGEASTMDEVMIKISDSTVITKSDDATNKKLGLSDIKVGDSLEIEISPAVAMSMPPQASAVTIKIMPAK